MTESNGESIGEVLTIEEIEERFDSEWILIGDPEIEGETSVLGGRILAHSKDRDEVYRVAVKLRPPRCAFHYTGRLPDDAAIIL